MLSGKLRCDSGLRFLNEVTKSMLSLSLTHTEQVLHSLYSQLSITSYQGVNYNIQLTIRWRVLKTARSLQQPCMIKLLECFDDL